MQKKPAEATKVEETKSNSTVTQRSSAKSKPDSLESDAASIKATFDTPKNSNKGSSKQKSKKKQP